MVSWGDQSVISAGFALAGQVSGVRLCRFLEAKGKSDQIRSALSKFFLHNGCFGQIKEKSKLTIMETVSRRVEKEVPMIHWPGEPYLRTYGLRIYELRIVLQDLVC